MKKQIIKPGFEFIFSLSILAVLGLPPLVFGQSTKDEQITIINGDTTVNGRNIKQLSPKERHDALKDIGQITIISTDNRDSSSATSNGFKTMTFSKHRHGKDSTFAFNYHMKKDGDKQRMGMDSWRRRDEAPMLEFSRKNTQFFNYTTTDNNGVSTHISFRISEPTGPITSMGVDADKPQMEKLDIQDLNIVPEFSAGKAVIMFTLLSKAPAEVQFKDSKGDLLWSERVVNGSFTKSFPLGLNGIYFLRVKQGGKMEVKKIFKEQL